MVAGQETHLALSLNQPYNGGTFEYGITDNNFNENNILTGGGKRKRKRTNRKRRSTRRKIRKSRGKRTKHCDCNVCECNPCRCTKRSNKKHSSKKRKTLAALRAQLKKYM